MNSPHNNSRGGYIAVTAAILIIAVTAVIVFVLGASSFLARENVSSAHFKEKSLALAEGCLEVAYLRLAEESTYAGGETVSIASSTCTVVSVLASSTDRVIRVKGQFQSAVTNLEVIINGATFALVSWKEF